MNYPTEKHKHKMEKLSTKKVMLTDSGGAAIGKFDIFTSKKCACGFSQAFKVERVVGNSAPKEEKQPNE